MCGLASIRPWDASVILLFNPLDKTQDGVDNFEDDCTVTSGLAAVQVQGLPDRDFDTYPIDFASASGATRVLNNFAIRENPYMSKNSFCYLL